MFSAVRATTLMKMNLAQPVYPARLSISRGWKGFKLSSLDWVRHWISRSISRKRDRCIRIDREALYEMGGDAMARTMHLGTIPMVYIYKQ